MKNHDFLLQYLLYIQPDYTTFIIIYSYVLKNKVKSKVITYKAYLKYDFTPSICNISKANIWETVHFRDLLWVF